MEESFATYARDFLWMIFEGLDLFWGGTLLLRVVVCSLFISWRDHCVGMWIFVEEVGWESCFERWVLARWVWGVHCGGC